MSSPAAINALLQKCVSSYIHPSLFFFKASANANSSCLFNKDPHSSTSYTMPTTCRNGHWTILGIDPPHKEEVQCDFDLAMVCDRMNRASGANCIFLPAKRLSRWSTSTLFLVFFRENIECELYFQEGDLTALYSSAQ